MRPPADHPRAARRVQAEGGRRARRARRRGGDRASSTSSSSSARIRSPHSAPADATRSGRQGKAELRVLEATCRSAWIAEADRRRGGAIVAETRRQRARRHGPGDGRGQGETGRQGRHGARVGCRQAGAGTMQPEPYRERDEAMTCTSDPKLTPDVCVSRRSSTPEAMAWAARAGLPQRDQQPARFRSAVPISRPTPPSKRRPAPPGSSTASCRCAGATRRRRRSQPSPRCCDELPAPVLAFCRTGARTHQAVHAARKRSERRSRRHAGIRATGRWPRPCLESCRSCHP